MKKKIEDLIKKLFDYQKFENNPKLDQTIKDSLKDDTSLVSDLQLSKVVGAGNTTFETKCPDCKSEGTFHKTIDPNTGNEIMKCSKCGYSEEFK